MSRFWKVVLGVALVAAAGADFLIPGHGGEHLWERETFFAWYGFLGCVAIILLSKALGKRVLQRPEDYWERVRAGRDPGGPAEDEDAGGAGERRGSRDGGSDDVG